MNTDATFVGSWICMTVMTHQNSKTILSCSASVKEKFFDFRPFVQTAIIEPLEEVINDERKNARTETLLEHDQPPNPAIAVLKRMNRLKADMEIKNALK